MKTLLFTLSICLFLISSCKNTPKNSSKAEILYIETTLATESADSVKATKTYSEVTSDYFEVSLSAQSDGGYLADNVISVTDPGKPFRYEFFTIVDKDHNKIKFMTSTEFLNFMSAHDYEMVDQLKNEYGGDYTFKKK